MTDTVLPPDAPPGAVKQIANGTWVDRNNRFLKGSNPTTALNADTARAARAIRRARKEATIAAAANAAIAGGQYDTHGDLAFVAALATAAVAKATNPTDSRAIDAARFLLTESGLSGKDQDDDQSGADIGGAIAALAAFAAAVVGAAGGAVVDADVVSYQGDDLVLPSGGISSNQHSDTGSDTDG